MDDWRRDRVGAALSGENPTVIARLPAAFAVVGNPQWLPGYCVLLTDDPGMTRLSDLSRPRRGAFLGHGAVGAAVELACGAADVGLRRVNLEILGNSEPYLHAHVWPRYDWEPPELVHRPVCRHPRPRWPDVETALGPQHDALRTSITGHLHRLAGIGD